LIFTSKEIILEATINQHYLIMHGKENFWTAKGWWVLWGAGKDNTTLQFSMDNERRLGGQWENIWSRNRIYISDLQSIEIKNISVTSHSGFISGNQPHQAIYIVEIRMGLIFWQDRQIDDEQTTFSLERLLFLCIEEPGCHIGSSLCHKNLQLYQR
jgi:hypothetical protein